MDVLVEDHSVGCSRNNLLFSLAAELEPYGYIKRLIMRTQGSQTTYRA
jgi:hypothetical protein